MAVAHAFPVAREAVEVANEVFPPVAGAYNGNIGCSFHGAFLFIFHLSPPNLNAQGG